MAVKHKYTTVKGRPIDWEKLRMQNQDTVAIGGEVRMNARGDVLGDGGRVIKTREQLEEEYNVDDPNAVRHVSIKDDAIVSEEEGLQQPSPQQNFEPAQEEQQQEEQQQEEFLDPQEAIKKLEEKQKEQQKSQEQDSSKKNTTKSSKRKVVSDDENKSGGGSTAG